MICNLKEESSADLEVAEQDIGIGKVYWRTKR